MPTPPKPPVHPLYGQMAVPQVAPLVLSAAVNVSAAAGYAPVTLPSSQRFSLFSGSWAEPVPYVLNIGEQALAYDGQLGSPYPPPNGFGSGKQSFRCSIASTNGVASLDFEGCAAVLEYGCRGANRRVYMDWKPGSYNVPPCDYLSLSVAPFGTRFQAPGYTFMASAAPGVLDGAHVPQVSGLFGGNSFPVTIAAPAHAQAVDFLGSQPTSVVTASPGAFPNVGPLIVRNNVTGVYLPPWGPVECQEDAVFTITDAITTDVVLITWYLRL